MSARSDEVCRFKLKFSPDKVDTMVVQAVALLDDLDKEINIYAMRVKASDTIRVLRRLTEASCRSGMVGISLRWLRSFQTTLPMQKSFAIWVS